MSKQVKSFVRTIKSSYPVSPTADDFNKVYFLQKDANSTSGYIKTGGKDYGNGIVSAAYNSSTHKITFTLADGTSTSEIDCSSFLVDGMVEDVKLITIKNFTASNSYAVGDFVNSGHQIYECIKAFPAGTTFSSEYFTLKSTQDISAGNYLYVDFNTASGKQDIFISLTDIFNPDNYYTKSLIDSSLGNKADKVSGATNGNFAGLDANGNLTDSGKNVSDFATSTQGTKADSAIQGVKANGNALTPDANKVVNIPAVAKSTSGVGGNDGLMTAADKEKLDGIFAGAEPNQNAFSYIKVGDTSISADSKMDNLEIVAGDNIVLTPDATNDKVNIAFTPNYAYCNTAGNVGTKEIAVNGFNADSVGAILHVEFANDNTFVPTSSSLVFQINGNPTVLHKIVKSNSISDAFIDIKANIIYKFMLVTIGNEKAWRLIQDETLMWEGE